MLKIEELVNGNDMLSIIFRDSLLKIGQLSTDHIFSTPDIASFKADIVPKIINPLTQFTDCKIRIKDFNRLSINIIFLIKEASLRGLQRVVEKREAGDVKSISFDRNTILKYNQEIDNSNYDIIFKFLSSNRNLNTETVMKMVESGLTKIKPFVNYRIELTMMELLHAYYPTWNPYLRAMIDKAYQFINEEEEKNREKLEVVAQIIENNKYYISNGNEMPKLVELRNKIIFDMKNSYNDMIPKEDIDKFLLDKNNFTIFQVSLIKSEPMYYGNFEGESYKIVVESDSKLLITENTEPLRGFSEKKLAFFREKIKPIVIGEVKIELKARYENYNLVYAFYRRKRNDIFDSIIESGKIQQLKILTNLLELDKADPSYKMYKEPVDKLIKALESAKVNELLLSYFKAHSKGSSFISKLFNLFFSSFRESEFVDTLNADKARASAVTKQLIGTDGRSVKPNETPVQSALNILKRSGELEKARLVLKSGVDDSQKVREILRICKDIGNTNKAHIEKTEKSKADFLVELKHFLEKN